MKLKTAIARFYENESSPARRADVVSFLRKYSKPVRSVTHYACRGQQTDAVTSFLDLLGFERDKDYRVVSSTFDPEHNSIRFTDTGKAFELVRALGSVRGPALDMMYATVAHPDMEAVLAPFSDSDEPVPAEEPAGVASDHFILRMKAVSDMIISYLCDMEYDETTAREKYGDNATKCIGAARAWATRMRNSPDRPFVLPLPILEAYYGTRINPGTADPFVFYAGPRMAQAVRIARRNEEVPLVSMTNAPIPELREGEGNPLNGYFCDTVKDLETSDLRNKAGVFAICDAQLAFGSGFDDTVTPAVWAASRTPLWNYVNKLYRQCYALNTGYLSNGMRVAVSDGSATWSQNAGVPVGALSGYNSDRPGQTDEEMVAKYSVLLTDEELSESYTAIDNFVDRQPTPTVVERNSDGVPDFTASSLSKDEAAWEWFCMTHVSDGIGSHHYMWSYRDTAAETDSDDAKHNFGEYRKWKARMTNQGLTALSRYSSNSAMRATVRNDGESSFGPISAFVDGSLPLALKLHSGESLPFADWGGSSPERHGPDSIVANVYSGIWTDLSPAVSDAASDGTFPSFRMPSVLDTRGTSRSDVMSGWLDAMSGDASSQTRFASRTKGTPRYASVIVETNVDADAYMSLVDRSDGGFPTLKKRLATAFETNVMLRRDNPYCVTDEEIGSAPRKMDAHDRMVRDLGRWYSASMNSTSFGGLCGNTSVSAIKDSYGRLVLVFTASGDDVTYARLAYRWTRNMPLATANVRAKLYSPGTTSRYEVVIPCGSKGEFDSVVKFLRKFHDSYMSGDYSGAANHVPYSGEIGPMHREPFGLVEPGYAPSRAWFLDRGTASVILMMED